MDKADTQQPADEIVQNPMQLLEDSLVICKFGRFHIQLMITSAFSVLATTAVTTTTSYILPSAECDLHMSLMQKGLLNAIPFLGQLSACLFTGFLTDAFGRKVFLAGGNFGLFICALFGATSQNYAMLLFGKLMEGILMSLVFTATTTMVSEFTHKLVRDRVLIVYAAFMSLAIIIITLMAWALLPLNLRFVISEEYFVIYSWNIYLYASAVWSLLAAVMYWQLPESPKFLLSHGQENEALQVLKTIYRINTGEKENSFPGVRDGPSKTETMGSDSYSEQLSRKNSSGNEKKIRLSIQNSRITSLSVSGQYKPTAKISKKKQFWSALFDTKELFRPPLIWKLALFSSNTFVCLLAYSALRLWFPQISTIIENYQKDHNGNPNQFCVMIGYRSSKMLTMGNNINESEICIPQLSGADTYTNGALLGFVAIIFISLSGYLVVFFGQKPLMFVFMTLCGICSGVLYWTNSSIQVAILISGACAFMQTAFSLQQGILVRVFPTTVRTIALSVIMMIGRAGSLIGNILFPIMMEMGCMVPFLTLSIVSFAVAGLVYFLPNPSKENVKTGDK